MSGKRVYAATCPLDRSHGPLVPLPQLTKRGEDYYCPHQSHDGWKERPGSRPFFTYSQVLASADARHA